LAFGVSATTFAQDNAASISSQRSVQLAIAKNPSLRVAINSLQSARYSVQTEENRYPFSIALSGGATRTDGVSSSSGSAQTNLEAAAELSRTFATGTKTAVRVNGYRSTSNDEMTSSPYSSSARLTVSQPLLRGAGTTVGEAQLRLARLNEKTARYYRDRAASELVRDVLLAYWDFWYTNAAVEIEQSARDLAATQLADAKVKAAQGSLPAVDVLTYETKLSSSDESLLQAKGSRRQAALSLIQTIGAQELLQNTALSTGGERPTNSDPITQSAALEQATANSPELVQRQEEIHIAEEQLRIAGDAYRSRLDLEAYLQVSKQGAATLRQLDTTSTASTTGTSAHVGLTYELPLNDPRRTVARSSALLAVSTAEENLRLVRQRLLLDVQSVLIEEENARERLSLAEQTSQRAEAQYQAERERFAAGMSLAIQIQQAQDEVRKAKLRVERARVDLCEAQIRRDHLTGALLRQIPADAIAERSQPR